MAIVLPEIEGWVKVLGAAVAILMAVLVPLRSWIVEDRRYRAQALEALSGASRAAVAGASTRSPTGTLLGDAVALEGLIAAVRDVAAAIRDAAAAEEAGKRDRLAAAVEALLLKDRAERGTTSGPG